MLTVLICALVGALVAGTTAVVLTQPHRDAQRLIVVSRLQAALGPPRVLPDECPVCVARHRYRGSSCEQTVTQWKEPHA